MGGGRRQWRQEAGSQMLWEKIVRKISAEANELRFTQYNMEEYSIPGIKLWVIWMARFWIASRLSDCALVNAKCHTGTQYSNTGLMTVMYIVFQKKNIHSYYWYKLRNSCLILIIFDDWHQNSSHNLTSHDSLVVHLTKLTCLHYLVKLINRILSPYITYFSIQVVDFRHQIFTNCWNNSFQQSTTVSVVFTVYWHGESCRRGSTTRQVEELRQRIVDEWERLDQRIIDGAVKEWRKRLRACAAAEGGQFGHELWLLVQ